MSRPEPDSFNPYTAPLTGPETSDPFLQDDRQIRQQFLNCEANICSIAGVLLFGGIILIVCGVTSLYLFAASGFNPALASVCVVVTMLGFIQFTVGLRVQRFHPRARIGAIIFSILWLLFFPIGTMIGGACLWYLARPAAAFVFTEEYSGVVHRTPQIRFRTSAVSWAFLAIVLLSVFSLFFLASG